MSIGADLKGIYDGQKHEQDFVRIRNFLPTLSVITSKQRPYKLTIVGSNGKEYPFLLKGELSGGAFKSVF